MSCIEKQNDFDEIVSIIVPIYNSAQYLDECLQSICRQEYKNIEIILVNDGSTDCSLDICKRYQGMDHRIQIYSITNQGVSHARNIGIKNSTGVYIAFVDADDKIGPLYIESLVSKMKESSYDISIGIITEYIVNTNKMIQHSVDSLHLTNNLYIDYHLIFPFLWSIFGKLYKASIIKNQSIFFDESLNVCEDQIFNMKYFEFVKKYIIFDSYEYIYYIRTTASLSKKRNKKIFEDYLYKLKYEREFLQKNNVVFWNKVLTAHCLYIIKNMLLFDNQCENKIINIRERLKRVNNIMRYKYSSLSIKQKFICFILRYRLYLPLILLLKLRGR